MKLHYDPEVDAASVEVQGPIVPGQVVDVVRLDADRLVSYDAGGKIVEYEFLNVRRYGVRLDDLLHRDTLASVFAAAGIPERDWSHPIPSKVTRRRGRAAG